MRTKKQGRKQCLPQLAIFITFCLLFPTVTANAGEILLSQVGSGQWQVSASEQRQAVTLAWALVVSVTVRV